jgi:hypothetical protein
MRKRCTLLAGMAGVALGTAVFAAGEAQARCTRLAFSVNDYGKAGPTKDALRLLDKYIADWTKARGIEGYTVGKKDVSCELFLNLIVVDEHTCKASALVCWPDDKAPPAKTKAPPAKTKAPPAGSKASG